MDDDAKALPARWSPASAGTTDWLRELCGDGLTGFLPPAMPDAAWVLNAMYAWEHGASDLSDHEPHRAGPAEVSGRTDLLPGTDPPVEGVAMGGGLGRAGHPGPGWRRLRWGELARRTGDSVVPDGLLPCYRCFPSLSEKGGWPLNITPPTEGSADRESWNRLIAVLTAYSPGGPETACLAYYNPMTLGAVDLDSPHVLSGCLGDTGALYEHPGIDFSPSNLWARDRSWVVCTDYDLWATKVAGPTELIGAILDDPTLEAIRLPWAP
ncbi:hypothetical protein [Streptomyces sp. G-5]|uniref:hypothetical protein n=1 Tax=Streptomyces sp. G-5 TaxID=2977231 RepID=UPI0021D27873|nr:hypothetical protein [Streptomyces sp. G-5]MCU4749542.1 hypothetical protein [Streptomyces sp. G-5]